MTVSAIYIMGPTGVVIISRDYRGDVTEADVDRCAVSTFFEFCRFAVMLREKEDTELKPVFTEGGTTYIYVKVRFIQNT